MERKEKNQAFQILKRLLSYMIKNYKFSFIVVIVCIVVGAIATMRGMLFVQSLVDDYITPLIQAQSPDFSTLARAL